jgi:hypothetical protein
VSVADIEAARTFVPVVSVQNQLNLARRNVIDLPALGCLPPEIAADLPAGGSRLVQSAEGYR